MKKKILVALSIFVLLTMLAAAPDSAKATKIDVMGTTKSLVNILT